MAKGRETKVGRVYNRWTVLSKAKSKIKSKSKTKFSMWLCRCECGVQRIVMGTSLEGGHTKSCGCLKVEQMRQRIGAKNPRWKGGIKITHDGYVKIRNMDYPGAKFPNMTAEHIIVMARSLNRPMWPGETVHHKNGVRSDNRLENLELWSSNHPAGQRVLDKVAWAKQLLQNYEPTALVAKAQEFTVFTLTEYANRPQAVEVA